MEFKKKYFNELSNVELYEILKARAAIFIVEQKCIYQDLDDIDYNSLHIFYEDNKKIIAYLRIFPKEKDVVQIGRVLSIEHGKGFGGKILSEGIKIIKKEMNVKKYTLKLKNMQLDFMREKDLKSVPKNFWKMEFHMFKWN